jgi:hypothetical protein
MLSRLHPNSPRRHKRRRKEVAAERPRRRQVFFQFSDRWETIVSPRVWLYITDCVFLLDLQKWSKGKVRDKLNNQVLFDKPTYEKLLKEVPSYKLITPSVVSERLKVRGSLARKALEELLEKGEFGS